MSDEVVTLKVPSKATLKKYGLNMEDWNELATKQGHVCYVCKKLTSTGRLCIDHEHVKGWKKLPPEQRKIYVRGLLCWFCNSKYLSRGITVDKLRNGLRYLEEYHARRDSVLNKKPT